jgi:hypothetical protein
MQAASVAHWQSEGKSTAWLNIPEEGGAAFVHAAQHGFEFHHAGPGGAMMNLWPV